MVNKERKIKKLWQFVEADPQISQKSSRLQLQYREIPVTDKCTGSECGIVQNVFVANTMATIKFRRGGVQAHHVQQMLVRVPGRADVGHIFGEFAPFLVHFAGRVVEFIKEKSKRIKIDTTEFKWPFLIVALILFLAEIGLRRLWENKSYR